MLAQCECVCDPIGYLRQGEESQELPDLARPTLSDESLDDDTGGRLRNSFSFLYTLYPFDQPPGIVVSYSITVLTVTVFILGFLTPKMVAPLADGSVWAVLALLLLLGVALVSFGVILLFQQSSATVRYKVRRASHPTGAPNFAGWKKTANWTVIIFALR